MITNSTSRPRPAWLWTRSGEKEALLEKEPDEREHAEIREQIIARFAAALPSLVSKGKVEAYEITEEETGKITVRIKLSPERLRELGHEAEESKWIVLSF